MASERATTRMTINLPEERVRSYFAGSFSPRAEAVDFGAAPGGRGTEVTVSATDEKLPYEELRELVRRAKQQLETGEVPTSAHRAPAEGVR